MPPNGSGGCGRRRSPMPRVWHLPEPSGRSKAFCMGRYRGNRPAIEALVRETEVHRDLYVDPEIFDLEMEHLFANTWVYVGHDSQVPRQGDYFTTTIGNQPIVMVRHTDNSVRVLY